MCKKFIGDDGQKSIQELIITRNFISSILSGSLYLIEMGLIRYVIQYYYQQMTLMFQLRISKYHDFTIWNKLYNRNKTIEFPNSNTINIILSKQEIQWKIFSYHILPAIIIIIILFQKSYNLIASQILKMFYLHMSQDKTYFRFNWESLPVQLLMSRQKSTFKRKVAGFFKFQTL